MRPIHADDIEQTRIHLTNDNIETGINRQCGIVSSVQLGNGKPLVIQIPPCPVPGDSVIHGTNGSVWISLFVPSAGGSVGDERLVDSLRHIDDRVCLWAAYNALVCARLGLSIKHTTPASERILLVRQKYKPIVRRFRSGHGGFFKFRVNTKEHGTCEYDIPCDVRDSRVATGWRRTELTPMNINRVLSTGSMVSVIMRLGSVWCDDNMFGLSRRGLGLRVEHQQLIKKRTNQDAYEFIQ